MNSLKLSIILSGLMLLTLSSNAQYYPNYSIPVFQGSRQLPLAWVGGLNSPQFSAADLNNDGVQDLVIFDREGNKFLTFINNNIPNTVSYSYSPKYELNFPVITDWALQLDFDHDNIPDLFAHTNLGVQVYKGYYNQRHELAFELHNDLLYFLLVGPTSSNYVNVPVTSVDIAAFCDMDNDGDIDILSWDINGGYVNLYQNQSEEKGYGSDSLTYLLTYQCWGNIFETSDSAAKLLQQQCPYPRREEQEHPTKPVRHSGSTTLAFDNNGNGVKEVIIGDLGFNDLVFLYNNGTLQNANLTYQDTLFPSYSTPAIIPSFPAAYNLDLNNDGLKDIVAAPNQQFQIENVANVWYYKNIGSTDSGVFIYQTDSLFTKDMVEVGEGASPVFVKLDNDSLEDLIISNYTYYNAYSQLAYYKNTGTRTNPQFTLITNDYMNLSRLKMLALHPTFGDLDGDGDVDMVLGNDTGKLLYFENTAAIGSAPNFKYTNSNYFKIGVGGSSTPQLIDVNKDGLLDLLVGNITGYISYFQNTGTASAPVFSSTPTVKRFGGVDVHDYYNYQGKSAPYLTHLNGSPDFTLLVGCANGTIYEYNNIDNNITGTFTRVDSAFSFINPGSVSTIYGADINGDGIPELAIGNYRGGVTIYDTASIHSIGSGVKNYPALEMNVYPNPSEGKFTLVLNGQKNSESPILYLTNVLGVPVHFNLQKNSDNKFIIDLGNCPTGIYFCQAYSGGKISTFKLMIEK